MRESQSAHLMEPEPYITLVFCQVSSSLKDHSHFRIIKTPQIPMASTSAALLLLVLLMLFANEATSATNTNYTHHIPTGSWLSSTGKHTSWPSPSGLFAFGFYPRGNSYAVGIWLLTQPNHTIVWTYNHPASSVSSNFTLRLTKEHGLLLHQGTEDPSFLNSYFIYYPALGMEVVSASMLDSGNFVLYDKDFNMLWQSFDYPGDTILGGQYLMDVASLVSSVSESDHSSGHFLLRRMGKGEENLAACRVNSTCEPEDVYWVKKAYFEDYASALLSLSIEGSLCLKDDVSGSELACLATSKNLKHKPKNTTFIYRATLDEDGNFRLYAHQFEGNTSSSVRVLWEAVKDKCQVPLCGLNSYCSITSGEAMCQCFPGFIPIKSGGNGTWFLDCEQNHNKDICESIEDPTMMYNVTSLKDIYWGGSPYLVVPMEMETCKKSCWIDCDCWAVLYKRGICEKYKLPLLYGRSSKDASTMAFLKMPSGIVPSPSSNPTTLSPRKPSVFVDDKKRLIMILSFTLGWILILGLVFVLCTFIIYRRQVQRYAILSASENLGFVEECSLRSFSFDELVKSTGGFAEEIGRGCFGAVYRGTIGDSNRRVAVKRLEKFVDQGEREFQAEITAVAQTHHRNLVKLIGFCIDGSRKLLVFEYLSNGSLADLLFKSHMTMAWKERLKIALDVARGILYLHEECDVRIIHCNIKPQNILMDEAWTAKISDFGFARLLKPNYSRMMKEMNDKRSRYLAPEWQKDESVSVKADVYSFGVVLLEIACRRSSFDMTAASPEEIVLSSWVYKCYAAGQLNKLVADDEGEDVVGWKILERMVKLGLWCVQDKPSLRPTMKDVILMLEGLKDIPVPPSPAFFVE
ncbi:hypothetical protein PIB30_019432 [Stylosanthes scabra]|uniref:Receptor-like serine/threonine-protein kinase n=1 Tax=Stylosanthes scabra TaxID=79078 RepID=A0ABU6R8H7_9FABA|nr:hypothetical protein [Stylosanthes scabra]